MNYERKGKVGLKDYTSGPLGESGCNMEDMVSRTRGFAYDGRLKVKCGIKLSLKQAFTARIFRDDIRENSVNHQILINSTEIAWGGL